MRPLNKDGLDPKQPLWLRLLYRLDFQVLECRWEWFCDWVHDLQYVDRKKREDK